MIRLLLALSIPTLLFAQSADLDVRIGGGPYDEQLRAEVTVEVETVVPLADAEEIVLEIRSDGELEIEAWSAPAGFACSEVRPRRGVRCDLAPAAAGDRSSVALRVIAVYDWRVGGVTASLTWRERGMRAERRSWHRDLRRYSRELAVTHTGDGGPGSLRQAIIEANALCNESFRPCLLRFDLPPGASIAPRQPLPSVHAANLTIDGDGRIALDGSLLTVPANGLDIETGGIAVRGLAIHSFPENGIEIRGGGVRIEWCAITGNGSRGITALSPGAIWIEGNVISGNGRSGIFADGGTVDIVRNRIGVAADGVTPLPNGASGVFIGRQWDAYIADNVIAHNAHFGVGTVRINRKVDVARNRVFGNRGGQIDIDLDGPSVFPWPGVGYQPPNGPLLLSAVYDPATGRTTVRGRLDNALFNYYRSYDVQFWATSAANELDQYLGALHLYEAGFTFTVAADLRGRFITANAIQIIEVETIDRGTSELSAPIEVK